MRISSYGRTDKGLVRSRNEDNLFVDDMNHIYAVADGLGGLPRGSLASNIAVVHIEDFINGPDFNGSIDFPTLFHAVNQRVHDEGSKVSEEMGIGTTLSMVHLVNDDLNIGHVGDCGIFLFRDSKCDQLTTDHTMEQEIKSRLQPDEEAYIPEYFSHTLTRCIGQQGEVEVDTLSHKVQKRDRVLICSDGITKTMNNDDLLEKSEAASTPEILVSELINTANERGGPDNSTAIAIFLD